MAIGRKIQDLAERSWKLRQKEAGKNSLNYNSMTRTKERSVQGWERSCPERGGYQAQEAGATSLGKIHVTPWESWGLGLDDQCRGEKGPTKIVASSAVLAKKKRLSATVGGDL